MDSSRPLTERNPDRKAGMACKLQLAKGRVYLVPPATFTVLLLTRHRHFLFLLLLLLLHIITITITITTIVLDTHEFESGTHIEGKIRAQEETIMAIIELLGQCANDSHQQMGRQA
eukprot:752932-Hanusia_phi.AAC.7